MSKETRKWRNKNKFKARRIDVKLKQILALKMILCTDSKAFPIPIYKTISPKPLV